MANTSFVIQHNIFIRIYFKFKILNRKHTYVMFTNGHIKKRKNNKNDLVI